jgi:hypothetical protein
MNHRVKILIALNLLGALVSLALFVSTWFARGVIVAKVQTIALETTRSHLDPVIPEAERQLAQPLARRMIPAAVKAKLAGEIEAYRKSPEAWLLAKASGTRRQAEEWRFPEVKNPIARSAMDFLVKSLAGASAHFRKSFDSLIQDLRIFAGTNLLVFLIAAALCFLAKFPQQRFWLTAWSAVLALATVLSINLYVGQSWVWNVLTNRYQRWTYAVTLVLISLYLAMRILPAIRREAR